MDGALTRDRRDFRRVGVFGSELLPTTSVIDSVAVVAVAFESDQDAVRELLPYHFEPTPKPAVRVTHLAYGGIDYLAGRGYNVLSVGVPVVLAGDESVSGSYNIVVWEGLSHAVNLGRELQGYAKIYGEVPDATTTPDGVTFECREYDTTLLHGEVHDLVAFTPDQLAQLQRSAGQGSSLGWKYIPGPTLASSAPDCDYATRTPNPLFYSSAWSAAGTVDFRDPSWEQAPISGRILGRLRDLPIVRYKRGFVGRGSASAPRGTIERLTSPA